MFHLIDSDVTVLNITSEIITTAGFASRTFNSPTAYLEYVHSAAFEPAIAILTCYIMPEMNGYELVTEVRKTYPHQKAAIISGSPSNDIPPEEENLVCLHLSKPYHAETFIKALKKLKICDHICTRHDEDGTFKQSCEYGLQHACPFYVEPCE